MYSNWSCLTNGSKNQILTTTTTTKTKKQKNKKTKKTVIPSNSASSLLGSHTKNYNASHNFKSLNSKEVNGHKDRDLCYYFDDKFISGYKCQNLRLFMMESSCIVDEPSDGAGDVG